MSACFSVYQKYCSSGNHLTIWRCPGFLLLLPHGTYFVKGLHGLRIRATELWQFVEELWKPHQHHGLNVKCFPAGGVDLLWTLWEVWHSWRKWATVCWLLRFIARTYGYKTLWVPLRGAESFSFLFMWV